MKSDVSPQQAIHFQMVAFSMSKTMKGVEATALRFIKRYWHRRVRGEPYRFTAVRFLASELETPVGDTDFERAASIPGKRRSL